MQYFSVFQSLPGNKIPRCQLLPISSELPEVMGMSDRVMVVREGHIVAAHNRGDATAEQIMSEMFGLVQPQKVEG